MQQCNNMIKSKVTRIIKSGQGKIHMEAHKHKKAALVKRYGGLGFK